MKSLSLSDLTRIIEPQEGPCVSIYLGGGRTSSERMIRYRKQLRIADKLLTRGRPARADVRTLNALKFFSSLSPEIRDAPSFCCFSSPSFSGFFPLTFPVTDRCVVASSFHVKPILQLIDARYRWFFCHLSGDDANLYRGCGQSLEMQDSISLRGDDHCKARTLDLWMKSHRPTEDEPAFLGHTSTETHALSLFSQTKWIERFSVPFISEKRDSETLLKAAWSHVKPIIFKSRFWTLQRLIRAHKNHQTVSEVHGVVKLFDSGIHTLAIRSDVLRWGELRWPSNEISLTESQKNRFDDCVLDDLAEEALRRGVHVISCDPDELPTGIDVIGIDRSWLKKAS